MRREPQASYVAFIRRFQANQEADDAQSADRDS
jgi:hypothetical protein